MADRGILHPDHAALTKARAGRPYRPSNGDEGEIFEGTWCSGCHHLRTPDGNGCLISLRAWAYDLGDEGYPAEWRYGADGQPLCAAFEDARQPPVQRSAPRCAGTDDLFASDRGPA